MPIPGIRRPATSRQITLTGSRGLTRPKQASLDIVVVISATSLHDGRVVDDPNYFLFCARIHENKQRMYANKFCNSAAKILQYCYYTCQICCRILESAVTRIAEFVEIRVSSHHVLSVLSSSERGSEGRLLLSDQAGSRKPRMDRSESVLRTIPAYTTGPGGLKTSSATFQRAVNGVLGDTIGARVMAYMDDISLGADTVEEHLAEPDGSIAGLALPTAPP